jgi:hypothetical protein
MRSEPADRSVQTTAPHAESSFPLRAFFGHHKCATGWTSNILREVCYHMGRDFDIVSTPDDFPEHETLGPFVEAHNIDVLAYVNANWHCATDLPLYRGFHVVRDPRDVLVSAYFSHKHSHPTDDWPELVGHRDALQELPKSKGLLREMEFSRPFFEDMYAWDYDQENVLELRMEALTERSLEGFARIGRFLNILDERPLSPVRRVLRTLPLRYNRLSHKGERFLPDGQRPLPVPRSRQDSVPIHLLRDIVQQHRFEQLAGRKRGEEDVNSHLRKGVPGDWKNHFGEEHIRVFKTRYNDLLLTLGYEDDPDWHS